MPKFVEGNLTGEGLKIGIVVARFNDFFSGRLLEGALDALVRHGVADSHITVARVPGAFEIPLAASRMAGSGQHHAIITLGVIVRGETPHFEYVSAEAAKGVAQVSLKSGVPVIFGVVTADTLEQAVERSGSKAGNKGFEAAEAAIEMANLSRLLDQHVEG